MQQTIALETIQAYRSLILIGPKDVKATRQ